MNKINIAIDGPSAAGKSTIAKSLANLLSYIHIDTGAMYRAIAYYCIINNIDTTNEILVCQTLDNINIKLQDHDIILNNKIITNSIRTNEISIIASNISKYNCVRTYLVKQQQTIAKPLGFIMDGRDIGSVVLKDAKVKIYLDASAKTRALRRTQENKERNIECDYDSIYQDILKRDHQDITRENSPLIKVEDAIFIDTSNMTIQQVIDQIYTHVKKVIND